MHTKDFVLIYNPPHTANLLLLWCLLHWHNLCGNGHWDLSRQLWLPFPQHSTKSNMPKEWKYLCYKHSWAECGWCLSLFVLHTVQQQWFPEFQECQYWEESGSAHRQAANLLLTTEAPQALTHFVQRGCTPSLRCFGGSGLREFLALHQKPGGREQAVLGALGDNKELTCTTGCMTAPSCLCLPLQHFSPLFHQSNRHGFNFPWLAYEIWSSL